MNGFIELESVGGGRFDAFVAKPSNSNGAAVVVLQEVFGVNDNIVEIAKRFAAQGYFAIAPDLYWRQQPRVALDPSSETDRPLAMALLEGLDISAAVDDALVAADHAARFPGIDGRVGCVGWCLGGKLAFLMAGRPPIRCAVAYYGTGIHMHLDKAADIRAPTLLHIAEADHLCPPAAREAILGTVADRPNIHTIVHPGVGHAFARRGSAPYDAAAAGRADAATDDLLRSALLV